MTKLLEIAKEFKVSRPIFKLTKLSNSIELHTVERYKPIPIVDDPLSEIVCDNYTERFSPKNCIYEIDIQEIASRSMEDIRTSLYKFLEKNLNMKNPAQSKLCRWIYRAPNNTQINDVFIMVYKYIRPFTDSNMRSSLASNEKHINNTIAILEAIMEKYE